MTDDQHSPAPNPYSPRENFFRAWGKDAQDRWVYVGLDHTETQELMRLQGVILEGDELVTIGPDLPAGSPEETDRFIELHDRHEAARLELCSRETAARHGVTTKPH